MTITNLKVNHIDVVDTKKIVAKNESIAIGSVRRNRRSTAYQVGNITMETSFPLPFCMTGEDMLSIIESIKDEIVEDKHVNEYVFGNDEEHSVAALFGAVKEYSIIRVSLEADMTYGHIQIDDYPVVVEGNHGEFYLRGFGREECFFFGRRPHIF